MNDPQPGRLRRELGLGGATMMGLGSMVGTGVFVSIGIAAGVAGPAVILAIAIAALVATANALSSAQLAASHAVSGGTYEYGYKYLNPALGFTAGWMFLCAKTASAATAALGFGGYLLRLVGADIKWMPWLAVGAVALFTILVLSGIRRSSWMNIAIVSVTLLALGSFILFGLPRAIDAGAANLAPVLPADKTGGIEGFLYATALMFVAYTGYARIATLGEEVRKPEDLVRAALARAFEQGQRRLVELSIGLTERTQGNHGILEFVGRLALHGLAVPVHAIDVAAADVLGRFLSAAGDRAGVDAFGHGAGDAGRGRIVEADLAGERTARGRLERTAIVAAPDHGLALVSLRRLPAGPGDGNATDHARFTRRSAGLAGKRAAGRVDTAGIIGPSLREPLRDRVFGGHPADIGGAGIDLLGGGGLEAVERTAAEGIADEIPGLAQRALS